jgi:hypothetical protein
MAKTLKSAAQLTALINAEELQQKYELAPEK